MPFRILADRTRGVSFAVMMLVPAAMFAMFYFLSLVVQDGMGYGSLKTGFAFLPFSAGIVVSAGIASSLMGRVDPKYLAGVGTLLAGLGPVRVLPAAVSTAASTTSASRPRTPATCCRGSSCCRSAWASCSCR